MRNLDLFFNKKSLFLMIMVFAFSFSVNAKKKPKPIFKSQLEVKTTKPSERSNLIIFEAEAREYDENFIKDFQVENKTDDRIYIEWENARIDGGKVVFGDDRFITKDNPKADEAVSSHSKSLSRDITYNTSGDYLIPLFRVKELKKDIGTKRHMFLTIPIRYMDNTIDEFEVTMAVWFELPSTDE